MSMGVSIDFSSRYHDTVHHCCSTDQQYGLVLFHVLALLGINLSRIVVVVVAVAAACYNEITSTLCANASAKNIT